MNRLEIAQTAYMNTFRQLPPEPWGVNDDRIAEVLEQALVDGQPLPESFDWYPDMPDDAVA
jgi:hypothetical protein